MTRTSGPDLYKTDFIAWVELQAAGLRAIPHPSPFGLDLPNLIGELETLARRDLTELGDRVRDGLVGLLLAGADPEPERARKALAGASRPLIEARAWRSPTGLCRLDLGLLWSEAWEEAVAALPAGAMRADPAPCPFRIEELLVRGFDLKGAAERVRRVLWGDAPSSPGQGGA